jgi:hypothetical protein
MVVVNWVADEKAGNVAPLTGKETNPKDIIGSGKPGFSSVPTQVMAEVGLAMLEGQKYGRHNYRVAGVRASVYYDAVFRHFFLQWWDQGEDIDSASGLNHIVKTIAGLCVLYDSILQGNFVDDRPPKAKIMMEELQKKADFIMGNIDPLPAWTEKRMNEKENEDVSRQDVESSGSAGC